MRQTVTLTLLYAFLATGPTFEIQAQDRAAQEREQRERTRNRQALVAKIREAGITGKMDSYISRLDGRPHPYAVCSTGESTKPKPLLLMVNPGATTFPSDSRLVLAAEQFAWYAEKNDRDCVVIRPTGRGPGSLYQNYGEVDVLEAIADVSSKHSIDPERILLIGHSMGGAATWYLLSHYPDLFAGGAPMSGYSDYRLWSKPGGHTFHMQPWEEASWKARSAAFLVENLQYSPVWIQHGQWDRGVGSGVPVAQSRRMAQLLKKYGSARYTEVPQKGHHFTTQEMSEETVLWLLDQTKVRFPKQVSFATYWLRHNESYWIHVDQLLQYGDRGSVDARTEKDSRLVVSTQNVRTLTIGPLPGEGPVQITVDHTRRRHARPGWQKHFPACPVR